MKRENRLAQAGAEGGKVSWFLRASFHGGSRKALFNDTIYVQLPRKTRWSICPRALHQWTLPHHALHTDLGHRCRGAKVDGTSPLNTPLQNTNRGNFAAKQGGTSRDWINPQLRFLASSCAVQSPRVVPQEY